MLFASDPIKAADAVSKTAVFITGGVLTTMIRTKLQAAILVSMVALGLLVPAWLAFASQQAVERATTERPAGRKAAGRSIDLEGNWILRGYPSGQAFGLIKIEGQGRQPHTRLLSVTTPEFYRFAESRVDRLRIDDETVCFTLHLQAGRPIDSRTMEVIVYLSGGRPVDKALWGSMEFGGQSQYPVKLERTDRTELDRQEGQAPRPGSMTCSDPIRPRTPPDGSSSSRRCSRSTPTPRWPSPPPHRWPSSGPTPGLRIGRCAPDRSSRPTLGGVTAARWRSARST